MITAQPFFYCSLVILVFKIDASGRMAEKPGSGIPGALRLKLQVLFRTGFFEVNPFARCIFKILRNL